MGTDTWRLCYSLPGVSVQEPVESPCLALVASTDPRLEAALAAASGEEADPAPRAAGLAPAGYLLLKEGAPDAAESQEALVCFRNALALGSLMSAWTELLCGVTEPLTLHSDSFLLQEPGAGLPSSDREPGRLLPGPPDLHQGMMAQWTQRFVLDDAQDWESEALFRSLALAFEALRAPGPDLCESHVLGRAAVLWTHAYEVLFRRSERDRDWTRLLQKARELSWRDPRLNAENYTIFSSWDRGSYIIQCGNVVERLFKDLFDARASFLRGEDMSPPRGNFLQNPALPLLDRLAPVLFQVALKAHFSLHEKEKDPEGRPCLEAALVTALG